MNMSETYKTTDITLIDKEDIIDPANILSETYYLGEKGDEIADYSYNFKFNTSVNAQQASSSMELQKPGQTAQYQVMRLEEQITIRQAIY